MTIVSLRNRTAGRRGRQNVCVWQTWQGYNLHVMSWSSLSINIFWFLQKDLFKGKWWLAKSYFKQICCHGCHTRFAVFFPLPSCCVKFTNVFRTKVLIGETTFTSPALLETGPPFYVVIWATRGSSHLQGKGSTFISQFFLKTLSQSRSSPGNRTHDLALCSQALYQLI